jgi:lysine-ketoglutarate reductase/saccharopine dehydrogenase-like protein (TIGR00300 family)
VVVGVSGIKIVPEFRERDRLGFAFMTNEISSERRVEVGVARIAAMMKDVKRTGDRIAFVAGPVVVHTGGGAYFRDLIRGGYVDVLLSGNALAVHDAEQALYGTSLGVDLETGRAIEGGHRHHMRAINAICRAGGLRQAVQAGVLTSGVMYECITHGVDYVLAGSVRDDGPLPDTVVNLVEAQDRYAAALDRVGLVLVLSSMLHGIGVGNMLPAWVRLVCVDINPAVVTKLADRGSSQTVGIVTDVGLFLRQLASALTSD